MKVIELAFTCYPVTDVPRARAFYEGILGLQPTMVNESEGGTWVEYEVAGGAFAIGKWEGWPPSW